MTPMITVNRAGMSTLLIKKADSAGCVKAHIDIARQGPRGLDGSGTGVQTYTHPQATAASVWVITHNLGKKPSVTVQDSAFDGIEGDVTYTDLNNLTISFSAAFSGFAYLN